MRKIFCIVICFLFFSSGFVLADQIVQGPFEIPGGHYSVVVKKFPLVVNNEPYSYLNIDVMSENGKSYTLDRYDHEGGEPKMESIFFIKNKKDTSIYTIVSWLNIHRAENINATYYKVYSYSVDSSGIYKLNSKISNDRNLSGFDGVVQGENMKFNYKTASEVKEYIKKIYN